MLLSDRVARWMDKLMILCEWVDGLVDAPTDGWMTGLVDW